MGWEGERGRGEEVGGRRGEGERRDRGEMVIGAVNVVISAVGTMTGEGREQS